MQTQIEFKVQNQLDTIPAWKAFPFDCTYSKEVLVVGENKVQTLLSFRSLCRKEGCAGDGALRWEEEVDEEEYQRREEWKRGESQSVWRMKMSRRSVPFCSILFRDKFRAPKLNLPKFAHCEGVCIRVHICAGVG